MLAGIVSVQFGAGIAARLFGELGPAGVTGLRLWWSALIMAVLGARALGRSLRQVAGDRAWADLAVALGFGVVLGVMNFSIYQAFARIPLGVAVTIEFLGPLAVAVASSRRRLDLLWVLLAAGGVLLLTQGGSLAASGAGHAGPVLGLSREAAGIGFALLSAACWAAYIVLSRATGRRFSGASGLAIAMIVAAVLVTGPAIAQAGPQLARPGPIAEGLAIGLLSSVIPYRLELEVLRRVRAGVFGIWMSLEPAVAALVGLILLGEALAARQWLAICLVVVASAGAAPRAPASTMVCVSAPPTAPDQPVPGRSRSAQPGASRGRAAWPEAVSRAAARVLLAPSAAVLRRWALAGLITSALIILTGAAVRLSQSGLGCPDWPNCTSNSLAAAGATGDPLIHRWIEFGNRLVTVAIFVVAVGVTIAAWRFRPASGRRRPDLLWLAMAQPAAIVAQAVLGGLVVLTKLNPALVSVHFLASVALVGATVALYVRCQEADGQPRPHVPRLVRGAALGVAGTVALMMAAGTVVTGTGPLAGAADVARYHLPLEGVTQLHADIGWLLGGLMVALLLGLHLTAAPARAIRLAWLLLGLIALQGAIGYAQYFSGLPAGLVWVHVAGSVAIWITALLLPYALRDRGSISDTEALDVNPALPAMTEFT